MTIKVNGGVLTDKSISGGLQHFILYGVNFGYVISDGTITLDSKTSGGLGLDFYKLLSFGKPVPNSSVDLALSVVSTKASIRQIGLVGDGITTEVHFCLDEHSNGWVNETGEVDVDGMLQAIQAIGLVTVPAPSGGSVNDSTSPPAVQEVDLSNVRLEKVRYRLGASGLSGNVTLSTQTVTANAPENTVSLTTPISSASEIVSVVLTLTTDPETVLNMSYVDNAILFDRASDYTLDLSDPLNSVIIFNEEALRDFGYVTGQEIVFTVYIAS